MNKGIIQIGDKSYKKCKVVMLPTEKATKLFIDTVYNKGTLKYGIPLDGIYQHLYILSDEEIKEGDWCIAHQSVLSNNNSKAYIREFYTDVVQYSKEGVKTSGRYDTIRFEKIIASTDLLVEKDNGDPAHEDDYLPRPSNAFLKAYCEKGSIDEVLVEYERGTQQWWTAFYKQNQNGIDNPDNFPSLLKIAPDNTITIKEVQVKESWSREEVVKLITQYGIDVYRRGRSHGQWIEENL